MKRFIAGFMFVMALAVVPWALTTAYMKSAGIVVTGKVVGKREAFLLPGGDTSKHIFEITYEYRPLDSPYSETVVQRVNGELYRAVRTGSPVQVRYSPSRLLRSFAGMGLYLEDASPLSRLHYGPPDRSDVTIAGALALALVLGLVAYRTKSKPLGLVAGVIAGACFPDVLLAACGLLLFPALFWASRRNPGKGYGVALLAAIVLSIGVVYWRVPQPPNLAAGAMRNGTARVRQVRVADEIWSDAWETYSRTNGTRIGRPFQMLDLEFLPEGASEPIHVLDRIDLNSVPGLREGAVVPVEYSPLDPDSGRIAGATRNYGQQNAAYLLLFAYGIGALVTFVFVPIKRAIGKLFSSSPMVRAVMDPNAAMTRITQSNLWSQLPKDDPRRKRLEDLLRARQRPRGGAQ